jgi:Txe/YoeB family toxin of Txe-Axe toxin-antitoxin module
MAIAYDENVFLTYKSKSKTDNKMSRHFSHLQAEYTNLSWEGFFSAPENLKGNKMKYFV